MSDVLTLYHHRSAPMPPSMRSAPPQPEAAQPGSTFARPQPKATPSVWTVAPEGMRQESPATLTERSVRARLVDEFSEALIDAIELSKKIVAAEVDAESAEVANAATEDAEKVVRRAKLGGKPRVMFSNDGILTLQWQRGEYGVALIFAGDGEASIAFRRPGQLYAENGIEVAISDDLPAQFINALAASS